ncbi:hypothetical protein ZOSMA_154G00020 [Zostera marina]|uniref:Rubisco accumulation factor 1, chloroplastic n=1 Tax=Zostera marina TaxID=29655 RepID=A0A0K9PXV6_ZOSMR|nr:hypothetical protein ZOSMA_154G00020 [Zostera marina]
MEILSTNHAFLSPAVTNLHNQTHISFSPGILKSHNYPHRQFLCRPISAARLPSPPPPPSSSSRMYQPFRPPPTPLPDRLQSLSTTDRLELLQNRMGVWYEFAPLLSSLLQEGFTIPSIEEATGISGVEQNQIIVAAQVRESLLTSDVEADVIEYFNGNGAEILYEIRLLSVTLRAASARHIVNQRLDAKLAQQLARAMKDFPRRKGDNGWECFLGSSPRDCLAYSYFRLSHESLDLAVKISTLNKALEAAETELAKRRINEELEKRLRRVEDDEGDELLAKVAVPVVRLRYGELTEWTSIAVLPVCSSTGDKESITMAPTSTFEGKFGIVESESGWKRWVVLPGWDPLLSIGNGVAVEFENAKMLPWKTKKWLREEEVMVIIDREKKEVKEEVQFYLVSDMEDKLKVERGKDVKDSDLVMGPVVLVVRPPRYGDDDQVELTDWEAS